ncbi:hypothetical protein [Escherichia coli]|uniref:hypothetical protein n=1 Tax=Escherichia coli TaxID=562 RepID=UPI0018E547F8|nr:hypothetical protein [Escherichia coli]
MPTLMINGSPTKYHAGYTTNISVDEILSGIYEALDIKALDNAVCTGPLTPIIMSVIKHRLVYNTDKWVYLSDEGFGGHCNGYAEIRVEYAVSYKRRGMVNFYFSGGMRSLEGSCHHEGDKSVHPFFCLMKDSVLCNSPLNICVEYNYNGTSKLYVSNVYAQFKHHLYKKYVICSLHDVGDHLMDKNILVRDIRKFYNVGCYAVSPRSMCMINTEKPFGEYLIINSDRKNQRFEIERVENEVLTSCRLGDKFTDDELQVVEMMGLKEDLWIDSVFKNSFENNLDTYPLKKYYDPSVFA